MKIVVLTGAGISAESGISTFRDANGLWEGHDIRDVASPQGWERDPETVLNFYNKRRKQLLSVQPNSAHRALAELEKDFDVHIITQNVDDLHERAGSSDVLHLHGELLKVRSTFDENLVMDWKEDLNLGDFCEMNHQLRPHIVWFGEAVPSMEEAIKKTIEADILVVIGTSLEVYPAAGLLDMAAENVPIYYVDPRPASVSHVQNPVEVIQATATQGVPVLIEKLKLLKEE